MGYMNDPYFKLPPQLENVQRKKLDHLHEIIQQYNLRILLMEMEQ